MVPVFGRDGWASGGTETGFQRELLELVRFMDDHAIRNVVFLGTDAHLPFMIRYEVDANGDGRPLVFHELGAGPLSAGTGRSSPPALDPTLHPSLLYSEAGLFTFGYVRVQPGQDGMVHLIADVRGEDGQPRPGSVIDLAPL
jgi:phosphodiesterase/alkaline phosphatase D-like protein